MIHKILRTLTLATVVAFGLVGTVEAIPIVSITPTHTDVAAVGDVFSVDIVVSGLAAGERVGGFSLLLEFDDAILEGVDYENDPDAKMSPGVEFPPVGFTGGAGSPLELFFVALAGTDLTGQGTGFVLASITFRAIATGKSKLDLIGPDGTTVLSDALGFELASDLADGTVCVGGAAACAAVPEPGLLALLGAGVFAAAVRRRYQSRA